MKKVEIYKYYSFGYNSYILLHRSGDKSNKEFLDILELYIKFIKDLNLKVTKSSLRSN